MQVWEWSLGLPRTRFVAFCCAAHKDGNFCSSRQWGDFRFGSAPSYLQDVCCTWHLLWLQGAVNFMQTPSKHSVPRAWGPLSRRHHKSIHAKIIHFHWTPSMREQGDWRLRRWRQWHEEKSQEKGRRRRGGSGRWVSTSTKHPEVNASPISPSLIVGCAHTNITNHYQSSIWSCKCSLGLRRIETPLSRDPRGALTAMGRGNPSPDLEASVAWRWRGLSGLISQANQPAFTRL